MRSVCESRSRGVRRRRDEKGEARQGSSERGVRGKGRGVTAGRG